MSERGPDGRDALREVVRSDQVTLGGLVGAMGGWLGIVESVLPSLVFLVAMQITHSLAVSLAAPLAIAVVFILLRLLRRSGAVPALSGAAAVVLSAVLAALTGDPKNFFGPGLLLNALYFVVFLVSAVVRRPILGVAGSFLLGDSSTWRRDPAKLRVFTGVTLLWTAMFGLRLLVEVPLYLAHGAAQSLGLARIVLGVPLYAPVLVLSVLAVQAVYRRRRGPAVS